MFNLNHVNSTSICDWHSTLIGYVAERINNSGKTSILSDIAVRVGADNIDKRLEELLSYFGDLTLLAKEHHNYSLYNHSRSIYYSENKLIYINKSIETITVEWLVDDYDLSNSIYDLLCSWSTPEKETGRVYLLLDDNGHVCTKSLKIDYVSPLNRGNYVQEVLKDFDHIKKDLGYKDPCGRLVLLDGPPGTGKSYMVRALISETNLKYLIIPSGIVPSLQGPELMRNLLELSEYGREAVVLIVEDADNCLLPRMTDNMTSLSTILNLCDGIVGGMFNIKIIATTNAHIKEMDPALLRPGRLCRRINLAPLPAQHATKLSKKLGHKIKYTDDTILAEVYNKVAPKDSSNFGFI